MAPDLWDYVAGGTADEITIRRNRTAFDDILMNPHFLSRDAASIEALPSIADAVGG